MYSKELISTVFILATFSSTFVTLTPIYVDDCFTIADSATGGSVTSVSDISVLGTYKLGY